MLLRKLATDTVVYGLIGVLGRLFTYFLVPLHISALSLAEYGILTRCYAYAAFLRIIFEFGIEPTYVRFYRIEGAFNVFIGLSLRYVSIMAIICLNLAYLFKLENIAYYLIFTAAADALICIPMAKLRLDGKSSTFAIKWLTYILLNVIFNFFFFYLLKHAYHGTKFVNLAKLATILYAPNEAVKYVFISNILAGLSLIILNYFTLSIKLGSLRYYLVKKIFSYALPIMMVSLFATINEMFSRALLKHLLPDNFYSNLKNDEILGALGMAYKFSIFMLLAIRAFNYAAEPIFFKNFNHHNINAAKSQIRDILYVFVIFACLVLLVVSLNLDIIGLLIPNPVFKQLIDIVPYLLLGYLFLGIYYNFAMWNRAVDKPYYNVLINSFGACITIFSNLLLIPIYGYWGSVISMIISHFSMACLACYIIYKQYFIACEFFKYACYISVTFLSVIFFRYIKFESMVTLFLFNSFFVLLFCFGLFWVERKRILSLINKI
jgi:O-antigen/teichoic acid export membrane protein